MNLRAVLTALSRLSPLSGALSALALIGCNGPPASAQGTLEGQTFAPIEAVSDLATVNIGKMAFIVASTEQGSCDLFSKNQLRKNAQFLIIALGDVDIPTDVPPGTTVPLHVIPPAGGNDFPVLAPTATLVTTPTISLVWAQTSDGSCMDQSKMVAGTGGKVTVTSVDDLAFEGSGDVTLTTGDHITFTFNSTPCYSLGLSLNSDAMPTCL